MNVRLITFATLAFCAGVRGQVSGNALRSGAAAPSPGDLAVLESRKTQSSLPCNVTPLRPELGFDFAFRAGYRVRLRLRDIADYGGVLTAVYRLTPEQQPRHTFYFTWQGGIPSLDREGARTVSLTDRVLLGEGDYQVDWLLRDEQGRMCSKHWRISARMPGKAGEIVAALRPGVVRGTGGYLNVQAETLKERAGQPSTASILLNIGSTILSRQELHALFSIVSGVTRQPQIGRYSITVVSVEKSQVLLRRDSVKQVGLPLLSRAVNTLQPGTISIDQLNDEDAEARFLARLVREQINRERPDAIIFIGATSPERASFDRRLLADMNNIYCPVFYLNYSRSLPLGRFPDIIARTVKHWKGVEFLINTPRDLLSAWSKISARIGEANPSRRSLGG